MPVRRALAGLVLLFVALGFLVEPMLGELRDGTVHHEAGATAAKHAVNAQGDHGHEDVGIPTPEHGPRHEHGTSTDHCTHQHGTAVISTVAFALPTEVSVQSSPEPEVNADRSPETLFHPPKA